MLVKAMSVSISGINETSCFCTISLDREGDEAKEGKVNENIMKEKKISKQMKENMKHRGKEKELLVFNC